MKFWQFIETLRAIPGVSVEWNGMPGFPLPNEPVTIKNPYDDVTVLNGALYIDSNEYIYAYGIQSSGHGADFVGPDMIPLSVGPKDVDLLLKEIIAKYANAEGDGGAISPDDVVTL